MDYGALAQAGVSVAGGITNLIGSLISPPKKPRVPTFNPVSPSAEARKAIEGNLANFGIASDLASRVNAMNSEELQKLLRANIPGYDALTKGSVDVITSQLKGELPDDVSKAVKRNAAERSVAGGTSGSEFARNLSLRDLGLTSLAQTEKGLDSASRWLALSRQAFTPQQFDVTSMFVSPAQQIQTSMWNEEMRLGRDWLSNQIAAMPSGIGATLQNIGMSMMTQQNTGLSNAINQLTTSRAPAIPASANYYGPPSLAATNPAPSYGSTMFPSGYPAGFFPGS